MKIKSPRHQGEYADRQLDCEEAMESLYLSMIEWAEAAGWSRAEAIVATVGLAKATALSGLENSKTDAAIQAARRLRLN